MKTLALTIVLALPALAQQKTLTCENNSQNDGDRATHCEMREQPAAFSGSLAVDAGTNGGVSIKGWDNAGVLVRARIQTSAADAATAQALASQIRVDVSAGQVSASGPAQSGASGWSVSYEIFMPRQGDLNLKAHNGGISVSDVAGHIQFATTNGGVHLTGLGGDVEGATTNGGVNVELAGARWEGSKLDARTTNGAVKITMPENYSAHLETATVHGHLSVDFPITVTGEIGRRLVTDLGSGGATIHVETRNGAVHVRRAI